MLYLVPELTSFTLHHVTKSKATAKLQTILHARPSKAPTHYLLVQPASALTKRTRRGPRGGPTEATLICYSQTFWARIKLNAWQPIEGPGAARCPLLSMCSSPFVSCLIFLRRDRLQAQALSPPPTLHKSPPFCSPHLAYAGSAQLGKQGTKDKKPPNEPRRRLPFKEMETEIT